MMAHRLTRMPLRSLPNISKPKIYRNFSTSSPKLAQGVQTSTLSNGIKVVTFPSHQAQAAVGVFINSGSRFEDASNSGASFYLKNLGFKATPIRTAVRLIREIELLGAQYSVSSGREFISYSSVLPADRVNEIIPILADVSYPIVAPFEVRDGHEVVTEAVHQIESNPESLSFELLHQEAYRNVGLGNSLPTPHHHIHELEADALNHFIQNTYAPKSTVLVATGNVKHEDIVRIAEDSFPDLQKKRIPKSSQVSTPSSNYIGGDQRIPGDGPTHLTIAFQGFSLNARERHAAGVLQYILGNSKSFLTEGPGRGLSGRLNTNVVSSNPWVSQASSFNISHSDSGLFGVSFVAQPGNVSKLAGVAISELKKLNKVEDIEVQRGKALYRSSLLFGNETAGNFLEYSGRRALFGVAQSQEEISSAIQSVTADEVHAAASKILKSKPTVIALGDVRGLPVITL